MPHRGIFMQLSGPETLPQLSRCAESYLRCRPVLVVLPKPLIYLDEKQRTVYQPLQNLECGAMRSEMRLYVLLGIL